MQQLTKYGFSDRIVEPFGSGASGIMIVGEAPGEDEDEAGIPFCPWAPAGSILERAIRRCGYSREQFVIVNAVPVRPPNNYLSGAHYEDEAVAWGFPLLEQAVAAFKPRCIVALGGIALRSTTGLCGAKQGISHLCGFLLPSRLGPPVIPCFHPSFMRRGAMSHFGLLLRTLRWAMKVAATGEQPQQPDVAHPKPGYCLYPTEQQALDFEKEAADAKYLAYDIETPYSDAEDEAEEASGTQAILSIQFATKRDSGIYFPWRAPYIECAKRVLRQDVPKLGWNNWRFDDPVLRANGCNIRGTNHDLMWAWHHLQPDLPRGLQFAAGQQGWPWPWKHLDAASPEFYGIVDVEVLQWMVTH